MLDCEHVSGSMPLAYEVLLDHCPIIMDIEDIDMDD